MVTRLARFLRRLDDWLADPETVPFSPVCCPPGSPVRSGRARGFRRLPPGHTPHCNKRGHAMSLAAVTDICRPCARGNHEMCTLHDKCGCEECNPAEPPVVLWEDPPQKYARTDGPMTEAVVAALKASPGRWARLKTFKGNGTAHGCVSSYRKSWPGFEFTGRRAADGSALYARFVGEVKP